MKKNSLYIALIFCLLAMSSFVLSSSTKKVEDTKKGKIEWVTFEEAMEKSAQDGKPIFIDVYTDWCGWCKKMDKNTFQTEEVSKYVAENYHAVKVDAESEKTTKLGGESLTFQQLSQHVFGVEGYPSIVLINSKKEFTLVSGYREKDEFIGILEEFKTASTKKKEEVKEAEDKIEWIGFEEAMKKSAKDGKPIFIDVYTDWCGWCKKMDKDTFKTDEVAEYVAKNYHAVRIDAESADATSFDGKKLSYQQLSKEVFKVSGYPSIVLINTKKEPTVKPGYHGKEDFIEMLKAFKTSK
ncbi:thioredoxin family protein [Bernardetia sp.]|uniref:thioredoxin family protein n=1 Tax=Bernardetia sp. TaxID=1937974 RepID=UPI0025BA498E|nr:DUF255 domain-containing protein [Bernardetia sp.]